VINYLESYQTVFDIQPMFNTEARSVRKLAEGWIAETNKGIFESKYVVMATGAYGKAKTVRFPGQDSFPGNLLHSYDYRTGATFAGQT
jgi:cation diffusion facilitator CzcD-associated flavoprotein CzcO